MKDFQLRQDARALYNIAPKIPTLFLLKLSVLSCLYTELPHANATVNTQGSSLQTEAAIDPKSLESWLPEQDIKCIEGLDALIQGEAEFSAASLVKRADIFVPIKK
jgi:hypothetical protein